MREKITETDRLRALVEIMEYNYGSTDFAQMLFFARMKRKSALSAYRLALNQWIRDGR